MELCNTHEATDNIEAGKFKHWHPVLIAKQLRNKPVAIALHGLDIVVFRSGKDVVALRNVCPHRGMRLSAGKVKDGSIVCAMHGWRFDGSNEAYIPGERQHIRCKWHYEFEAIECFGLIWLKPKGVPSILPDIKAPDGFEDVVIVEGVTDAGLGNVLDLFSESEHTGQVHQLFGYEMSRIHEISFKTILKDDTVITESSGPYKHIDGVFRYFQRGATFKDTWVTKFSPVYNKYVHYVNQDGKDTPFSILYIFMTPLTSNTTKCFVVCQYHSHLFNAPIFGKFLFKPIFNILIKPFIAFFVWHELMLDMKALSNLGKNDLSVEDMLLRKSDDGIIERREYMDKYYYQIPSTEGRDTHHNELKSNLVYGKKAARVEGGGCSR